MSHFALKLNLPAHPEQAIFSFVRSRERKTDDFKTSIKTFQASADKLLNNERWTDFCNPNRRGNFLSQRLKSTPSLSSLSPFRRTSLTTFRQNIQSNKADQPLRKKMLTKEVRLRLRTNDQPTRLLTTPVLKLVLLQPRKCFSFTQLERVSPTGKFQTNATALNLRRDNGS